MDEVGSGGVRLPLWVRGRQTDHRQEADWLALSRSESSTCLLALVAESMSTLGIFEMHIFGFVAAVAASFALAGCVANQQVAEQDPMIWGRLDCRRAEVEPAIAVENERVKAVCLPRAEAAAIAGTSAMPVGYGIGGAIASGISQGIASNQIATKTLASCLAEHGYLNRRRSEHEAYCAAMAPPPPPPPPLKPRSKQPPRQQADRVATVNPVAPVARPASEPLYSTTSSPPCSAEPHASESCSAQR